MAGDRKVVVEIIGDSSKFTKSTQQAVSTAQGMTGKIKTVTKGIGLGIGLGVFSLVTDAIAGVVDVAGQAKAAFEDDQVSAVKLQKALENNIPGWDGNTKAVEDYALAQEALGFSDNEVRDSLGQLIGVTHDQTEAMKLNALAQDLARAKGIDLATASDIVTKAYQGNGKALKALGIDTAGATTAAGLLDAVQKNVTGSAEAWAATNEGKLAVSNQKVGEAMEKVGSVVSQVAGVVLPILADGIVFIIDLLSQWWDAIQPIVQAIAKALIPIIQKVLPIVQKVIGAVITIWKALAPIIAKVFEVIGAVIGWWVDNVLLPLVDIVGKVIDGIVGFFTGLGKTVDKIFKGIGGVIRGIINAIINVINTVIRGINSFSIPKIEIAGNVVFGGWGGLNIRQIPHFHQGGVVPGQKGSEVLAVLQAGEQVTPAGGTAPGQTIIIQIESFIGSDADIDRFADKVARRLRIA